MPKTSSIFSKKKEEPKEVSSPTEEKTTSTKERGFIVVTQDFSGLGWAKKLQEEGNEVILAYKLKDDEEKVKEAKKIGHGIVEVEELDTVFKDRKKYKDWYWIFDMNVHTDIATTLNEEGFKVLGGQDISDKLEHDRNFASELMEEYGIKSPPTHEFTSIEEGLAFLDENPDKAYVFKPDEPKGACCTYVPDSEKNEKANHELYVYLSSLGDAGTYILQERIKGVEACFEVWFYKGKPFFANCDLECKKKLNQDLGAMVGCAQDINFAIPLECKAVTSTVGKLYDFYKELKYTGFVDANVIVYDNENYYLETCFDDKTEILTKDGWKFIKDVPIGSRVATLNRKTHELEYQNTTDLIIQDYDGEMIKLESTSVDVLTTPTHNMYVKNSKKQWVDVQAKDLKGGMVLKRDSIWKGSETSIYVIPEYTEKHYLGKYKKTMDISHPAKTIPMDTWISFLALYLSEGSQDGNNVNISQFKFCAEIETILKQMPFEYRVEKSGFRITSVQLSKHLKNFGLCYEKYVPSYIKELSPRQIEIFLKWYCLGDGSIHKRTKQRSFFTTSKKMSDDLQELIFKVGNFSNVKENNVKGTELKGLSGNYKRKHNIFVIAERKESGEYYLLKNQIKKQSYTGKVYCVTVPNHTIYIRRNGKALWVSNCNRFGYNSSPSIFFSIAKIPVGELLANILDGDVDNFYDKIRYGFGASATLYIDDPQTGLPIFIDEEVKEHFYLFDGYQKDDQLFMSGYCNEIGIIMAHAYTIREAAEELLEKAKMINFPTRAMRTDMHKNDYHSSPDDRHSALDNMKYFD